MKYRNLYISPKYSQEEKVYFGNVSGVSEIDMIEAATIDDFERLFHDAVDDYYMTKQERASKKKLRWLYFVLPLIVLIVIALLTCPDKSKHLEVLKDKMGSVLNEQLLGESSDGYEVLGVALINGVLGQYLKNYVSVEDYALFNVGKAIMGEETNVVSIGAFGHVFSVPKKTLEKRLNESEEFQEIKDLF